MKNPFSDFVPDDLTLCEAKFTPNRRETLAGVLQRLGRADAELITFVKASVHAGLNNASITWPYHTVHLWFYPGLEDSPGVFVKIEKAGCAFDVRIEDRVSFPWTNKAELAKSVAEIETLLTRYFSRNHAFEFESLRMVGCKSRITDSIPR